VPAERSDVVADPEWPFVPVTLHGAGVVAWRGAAYPDPITQPDPLGESAPTTDVVARLLAPLSADQQRGVNLIASQLETGRWPIFDFIDGEFERHDIDAVTVLDGMHGVAGTGNAFHGYPPDP
jgi:hypothetical protein